MASNKAPYTSFNRYFLALFILWAIVGGVLLLAFDRRMLFSFPNLHHYGALDSFFFGYTNLGDGTGITLILLLLVSVQQFRNWWYLIAAIVCNALPALVVQVIKFIVNAPRPLEYFKDDASWIHVSKDWPHLFHHSFPSGHTAGAFSLFTFLSLLLPKKYQPFGILFFFMALMVGYSRMYLAAHFYDDVYVGSLVGTTVTLIGFAIVRHYIPRFYGPDSKGASIPEN